MTKTLKTNPSHSDANYLVKNNLESFLNYFNLDLNKDNIKYFGTCPIHSNSDNPTAILIYKNTGIWLCNTHHCHEFFGRSGTGLIRALLSVHKRGWESENDTNKIASINETIAFIFSFLNKKTSEIIHNKKEDPSFLEKSNFIRQTKLLKSINILGTRDSFRKQCKIPSNYYLQRGFSPEILDKYDVGIMQNNKNYFYNRTIVPIYDIYYQYIIGYTARVNLEKCLVCGGFHNFSENCIDKQDIFHFNKWQHNYGFKKESTLYNYWYAKECINQNHRIILAEGPSDIWKLEMADICYGVAIFGSNLSTNQINLIKKSYIKDIWLLGDNDNAGEKACFQMEKTLGKEFSYHKVELKTNDLGDMSIEDIRNIF